MPDKSKDGISQTLLVLTSSAMALPGLGKADVPPDKPSAGFRFSSYTESDTSAGQTLGGTSISRYDIDVLHARVVWPQSDTLAFAFDFDYETMSGATPWYVAQDPTTQEAVVVMTGASVDDTRYDMKGKGSYYIKEGRLDATLGLSTEEDYEAFYGGLGVALEFYNKHVTVDVGVSFSVDRLEPTVSENSLPGNADRIDDARKSSFGVYVGFSQVLNRFSTFQSGINYTVKTGYLTDPYKLVAVLDPVTSNVNTWNENRPGDRLQLAWTSRYRLFFERYQGALHLDYRFYSDNWSLDSHTIDASWYQTYNSWTIVPGFRYYTQSEASFYEPYFSTASLQPVDFASSDYRLSGFDATSFRFKLERSFGVWHGIFSYEIYSSSGDSPALVDFDVLTLGFDYKF